MHTALDRETYRDSIARNAQLLAAAASAAGADAPIPTCPGWAMRDLLLHQGEVHRWATVVVVGGLPKPSAVPADHLGPLPDDDELVAWFERGAQALVTVLAAAPDDLNAFTFLADPPSPAVFWHRRQTHETGIHRVDAESAVGSITPFDTPIAADGIDEMLTGFVPRPHTPLRSDPPRTLSVTLTDHPGAWHVAIADGPAVTTRESATADCSVSGGASDVYRALWNRGGLEPLVIAGDRSVLDDFRTSVQISWR